METIGYYAFVGIVLAIPVGLIYFAASRAHRICKTRAWPRFIALGVALLYLLVSIAPYAIYGSEWAMAWAYLALPFSMVLEVAAPLGVPVYIIHRQYHCRFLLGNSFLCRLRYYPARTTDPIGRG